MCRAPLTPIPPLSVTTRIRVVGDVWFRRPILAGLVLAIAILFAGLKQADAAIIVGPTTLPNSGSSSDTNWGIQFTALQNTTLTGFDYYHLPTFGPNPFTGTITLTDITTSTAVFTSPYGPGAPTIINFSGLNIALNGGDKYQLVATAPPLFGAIDEVFQYVSLDSPAFAYPVSNADISVTSGVFSGLNTGFEATAQWASFKNIVTATVPEPASLASFLLIGGVLAGQIRCRRRKHEVPA